MLSVLIAMLVPAAQTVAVAPGAREDPVLVGPGLRSLGDEPARQVRIEERIIVRIPPGAAPPPRRARRMEQPPWPRWRERKAGRCLPLRGIAGLSIDSPRTLLLFMRDRRLVRARLDRTCSAREFYSGFYVQRSPDGQLCTGRDMLLSRSGTSCTLVRLRLLTPGGR